VAPGLAPRAEVEIEGDFSAAALVSLVESLDTQTIRYIYSPLPVLATTHTDEKNPTDNCSCRTLRPASGLLVLAQGPSGFRFYPNRAFLSGMFFYCRCAIDVATSKTGLAGSS